MKKYNIQNYIRYKNDVEKSIKNIPKKDWVDYTRGSRWFNSCGRQDRQRNVIIIRRSNENA